MNNRFAYPRYKSLVVWSRMKRLQKERARIEKGIEALNIVIRLIEERQNALKPS